MKNVSKQVRVCLRRKRKWIQTIIEKSKLFINNKKRTNHEEMGNTQGIWILYVVLTLNVLNADEETAVLRDMGL